MRACPPTHQAPVQEGWVIAAAGAVFCRGQTGQRGRARAGMQGNDSRETGAEAPCPLHMLLARMPAACPRCGGARAAGAGARVALTGHARLNQSGAREASGVSHSGCCKGPPADSVLPELVVGLRRGPLAALHGHRRGCASRNPRQAHTAPIKRPSPQAYPPGWFRKARGPHPCCQGCVHCQG